MYYMTETTNCRQSEKSKKHFFPLLAPCESGGLSFGGWG